MPDLTYVALDRAGKQVTGSMACRDKAEAAVKLRAMGLFPVEVGGGGKAASGNGNGRAARAVAVVGPTAETGGKPATFGKKVGRVQILLFTRELADLIDAGLPIDRALTVLLEQSDNEALQAMVQKLQGDVRAGNPLSDAMRSYPREFPALYANMIRAGEMSGQLASVMTRLADFMEKEQIRRSQVMAALTYPMVLVSVALLAVTFLLTFVIPKLQGVFSDLGADLPVPTRVLLASSAFVTHYYWAIALGLGGVYFLFRTWTSTAAGRYSFDGFKLTAPLAGALTRKIVMARYVRTLGTLLNGGVAILESLEIAASAVGNSVTAAAVMTARDGVRQGETLSGSMNGAGGFLPLVVHMSAVGEETGRLGGMLVRTADTLDFEVDNAMRRLTSLVEPLVVLLMGTFVGFVVLSILLPIFEANSLVK